jgi:hypothetical protein
MVGFNRIGLAVLPGYLLIAGKSHHHHVFDQVTATKTNQSAIQHH